MHLSLILWPLVLITAGASAVEERGRAERVSVSSYGAKRQCTVTPIGNGEDDVPRIMDAFRLCGNNGVVIFPKGNNYTIATRINPVLSHCEIQWGGTWTMTTDVNYWRANSYHIEYQNHAAGIVFTGDHISIDGYGTGGINGNGDYWYTLEAGDTQVGRPMAFVWWNVSDVTVKNFEVKDSPLWSLNIMNGTNMKFENIFCTATATQAPYGVNWVQNTDGFDTMDAHNIRLTNFYYQGGDDCIAIKPRSFNIVVHNVTCHGGNGVAIGSLGQYAGLDSTVEDVSVTNVKIQRYNEDAHNSAYIKTWVGALVPQSSYESAGKPRGNGKGSVRNIYFGDFVLENINSGPAITEEVGNNGLHSGTSNIDISNVTFENFSGYLHNKVIKASVSCSARHPCSDINFKNVNLRGSVNGPILTNGVCMDIAHGGVTGLGGASCTY